MIKVSFYSFDTRLYRRITRSNFSPQEIAYSILKFKRDGFDINVEVPLIPRVNDGYNLENIKEFFSGNDISVGWSYIIPYGASKDFDFRMIPVKRGIPEKKDWKVCPVSFSGYSECWATHLAVDPNLNVYPCIFAREYYLGNLKTDDIKNIFEAHEKAARAYAPDKLLVCKKCAFRYLCRRCPPRAKAHGILGIGEAGCPLVKEYPGGGI